jgi:hypothetical protein
MTHPLAGPIFTAPKPPTSCGECRRKAREMASIYEGRSECAAVVCRHRNRVTVQPKEESNGNYQD